MTASDRAIIVADGDVDMAELGVVAAADPRPRLIAADAGAGHVLAASLVPDLVLGDLDSLSDPDRRRLEELGVELHVAARDKDESDMELCLVAALDGGARHISLLGARDVVRAEHSIANVLLLADPRLDRVIAEIIGHGSRIRRIGTAEGPGRIDIEGATGDYVSLLPLSPLVRGVSTDGLRVGLRDEELPMGPSRGLSNEMTGPQATVRSERGLLLVVHTDPAAEYR
mgnify:CR=1 FL=1